MNIDRINALADLIEKQPHTSLYSRAGFNMSGFTHFCGTPACIAGWAIAMSANDYTTNIDNITLAARTTHSDLAGEYLGITDYYNRQELFFPINMEKITPAQAANTLRHFAKTGDIVWGSSDNPEAV